MPLPCVLVPASLCRIVLTSFDSVPLRIVLMLPLTILAGYGFQCLGFVAMKGYIHPCTARRW
jgi:hypothetical protein